MECAKCGSTMHWEGTMMKGGLVCPFCDAFKDMVVIDEVSEFNSSQLEAAKRVVGDFKSVFVELQCASCGQHCRALDHYDPNNLMCPSCNKRYFLRRV